MIPFWYYLRQSYHWRLAIRVIVVVVAFCVLVGLFVMSLSPAKADTAIPGFGQGCETVHTGLFREQRRTVCDGPKRADGSWEREREIWIPAGWVPGFCSGYDWTSSCTQSYPRARSTVAYEQYPVTDATVLSDEPGWLAPGTVIIR